MLMPASAAYTRVLRLALTAAPMPEATEEPLLHFCTYVALPMRRKPRARKATDMRMKNSEMASWSAYPQMERWMDGAEMAMKKPAQRPALRSRSCEAIM